jgi:hypothetical protein
MKLKDHYHIHKTPPTQIYIHLISTIHNNHTRNARRIFKRMIVRKIYGSIKGEKQRRIKANREIRTYYREKIL